ncbi:hypothetical protein KC331_g9224 [Hortaea werneckii]|nr:hypothetical protein KC331_g9224 [Hortaea werneckii]KAI7712174.1 hypothetical protein KC353_g8456 [Hortaea werneckii]
MDQNFWTRGLLGRTPLMGPPMGGPSPMGFGNGYQYPDEPKTRKQKPRSNAALYNEYGKPFSKDSAKKKIPRPSSHAEVPFEQAARICMRHWRWRSGMSMWAPPDVIDDLWTMKLEWNGRNMAAAGGREADPLPPVSGAVTYLGMAERVMSALVELKSCSRPRAETVDAAQSRLGPQVFTTTMKKLRVAIEGLDDLMEAVVKDRSLMGALVKEMVAAIALLDDIEDLWQTRMSSGTKGKGRAKTGAEEFSWVP